LLNVSYQRSLFWDGRRDTLEGQAPDPFLNPAEHGLTDASHLLRLIRSDAAYGAAFERALGLASADVTLSAVAMALAAFERTLNAGNSAFDRYHYGRDERALDESARRGLALFTGRAQCANCHTIEADGATFSDGKFHGAGVGGRQIEAALGALAMRAATAGDAELDRMIVSDPEIAALGRFAVTRNPAHIGLYKTPSLRNVALTAPYMHDGSVATLEEAVEQELYYRSVRSPRPVVLTEAEKADLIAFLRALTSEWWPFKDGAPAP
jgi:cytochrome c peroxidase